MISAAIVLDWEKILGDHQDYMRKVYPVTSGIIDILVELCPPNPLPIRYGKVDKYSFFLELIDSGLKKGLINIQEYAEIKFTLAREFLG